MSKTTCSDATNNTDGSSSFGLDNTSFGIVTNSTSRRNRLEFSALGLCDNSENKTKTAKEVISGVRTCSTDYMCNLVTSILFYLLFIFICFIRS